MPPSLEQDGSIRRGDRAGLEGSTGTTTGKPKTFPGDPVGGKSAPPRSCPKAGFTPKAAFLSLPRFPSLPPSIYPSVGEILGVVERKILAFGQNQREAMDSRENPSPQPHQHLPNMMVGLTAYPSASPSHMINNPNAGTGSSTASISSSMMLNHHPHHPQQQQPHSRFPFVGPPSSEPMDSIAAATGLYDGSSPPGISIEPAKKKRGRPRKYAPEGNIALGLGPALTTPSSGPAPPGSPSTEPLTKKNRGRPPGTGKKQMDALGTGGIGFTPHVIMVKAGEDIASKIVAFSQDGPRTICILSANGAVSNFSLKQPSVPGSTATYEGRYEIISLAGSVEFPEDDSSDSKIGGLSVSLAGPDGHVIGGLVAGILTAATPVQVIIGSFLASKKKSISNSMKSELSSAPQSQMVNFGAPAIMTPPSQDGSSGSSEENVNGGSQMAQPNPGYYNEVSQPMHNMHMYHHLWASQAHR
ncbi:hypothetical protein SAY86_022372 [Trapa natans]|uniref:AT-hook motif nuclear-localized protein n=1 Tax=Trapa natans TaxID=22666 RepID=A0AAN7LTD9_TRANT|nr:hypothetical protein SAY86_022372 [Trapa natans]